MTTEEIINAQRQYLADFKRRATGSKHEQEQAKEEARRRLVAAGIIEKNGQLATPFGNTTMSARTLGPKNRQNAEPIPNRRLSAPSLTWATAST